MGYVFVSHSSEDTRAKAGLKRLLNGNGIEGWFAPDDIPAGSDYASVIINAIKNCSCVILLLSSNSLKSKWVAKEIERAVHYEKPIITVKLEEVTLTDALELYISTDQIISLSRFSKGNSDVARLLSSVSAYTAASGYSKSELAVNAADPYESASTLAESEENHSKKGGMTKGTFALIVSACLVAALIFTLVVPALSKKPEANGDNTGSNTGTSQGTTTNSNDSQPSDYLPPNTQVNTPDNSLGSTDSTEPDPSNPNQIPQKYEQDVLALQNADALSLSNKTVYVKVGEYATPGASTSWPNVVIYSQDSNIALGEGKLIKGVAQGETYVIVETNGMMGTPYRVIVEE